MGVKMIYPGIYEFKPELEGDDSEKLQRMVRFTNLPAGTRFTKRLSTFEEIKGREAGLQAAMEFIRGEIDPPLLLLYGEPGRSKTHLALAIGWCFVAQLKLVNYYHVGDLLDYLRAGYKIENVLAPGEFHPDSYDTIMHSIKGWNLLILDDLGMEKMSDWTVDKLDTVVNHRFEAKLPTVITANTLEISDRILDRCKEGKIALLEGESYREIIAKRKKGTKSDHS